VTGDKGLAGVGLVILAQLELLKQKVGPRTHKGVSFGREHGFDMAGILVQAAQQVQHLARLINWMADVAKVVGELLQLGAVVRDGEITLDDATKLGIKEHRALHLIVSEKTFDVRPNGECGGIRLVDEVEDALGDGGVEPIG
jgi:hypothetical protein